MDNVFIIVDKSMHSYEAICGVFDSFESAMNAPMWEDYELEPDSRGSADDYFIVEYKVNRDE